MIINFTLRYFDMIVDNNMKLINYILDEKQTNFENIKMK